MNLFILSWDTVSLKHADDIPTLISKSLASGLSIHRTSMSTKEILETNRELALNVHPLWAHSNMNSQELRVILDDGSSGIQYGGGNWSVGSLVRWYQGITTYPAFTGSGAFGTLNLAFEGTSIAFIGNTPAASNSQFATISIDGGAVYNSSYGPRNVPQSYIQWYQSPTLSEGKHTIAIDHLDGTAIDIIIITVGPTTPLANKMVFVDNDDLAIEYTGNWTENGNRFEAGHVPNGLAVGNTTQRSATVGDTFTFRFSGTSINIYGIFSWTNLGSFSVACTLDGVVETLSYSVTETSAQYLTNDGESTNFSFFGKDAIPIGNHTLILNITDISNQTFIFDYLVYSPSFYSLATMPNLTSTSRTNTSSNSNSSIAMQTGVGGGDGRSNRATAAPIGTIVGEAVGGILGFAGLVTIILLYLRNKYAKGRRPSPQRRHPLPTHNDTSPHMSDLPAIRPIFGRSVSSRDDVTPFHINSVVPAFNLKRNRMGQGTPGESPSTWEDIIQQNPPSDLDSVPPAYELLWSAPSVS